MAGPRRRDKERKKSDWKNSERRDSKGKDGEGRGSERNRWGKRRFRDEEVTSIGC